MLNILELRSIFRTAEFVNCVDGQQIASVEHDTRRIKPKSLYVAIKGENLDGHDFIKEAQNKGAVACLCEKKIQGLDLTQIVVADTVKAYGELAAFWRHKLKCSVVALTGSNGKTTTKDLIYTVLSKKFKTVRTIGNFNNLIGVPYTILSFPIDAECAIVEMGMNAKGEIGTLSKIADPDIALITNIGRAHIGRLGSLDAVAAAKMELFDHVLNNKGSFCLNMNDERIKKWMNSHHPQKHITYCAVNSDEECFGDICIKALDSSGESQSFKVHSSGTLEELSGEIGITGFYNLINVAAAVAVGVFLGMEVKTCVGALKDFVPPSMRSNILKKEGIAYIVDCYNANPDSMLASIKSLKMIKEAKRKIVVVGDMFELDGLEEEMHKEVGKVLAQDNFDAVYVIGKYSSYYKKGFDSFNGNKGKLFTYSNDQMQKLKQELFTSLKKGDYVLVKASRASRLETIFDK